MDNRILQIIVSCVFSLSLATNPVPAQEIMSYEEFQQTDFDEPYVIHLNSDSGELLYFGSSHSFNPDDTQFDKLSEEFMNFSPDVVYTEGFPEDVSSLSTNEAIQRFGEFGLTWKLASEADIEVFSLEPDRKSEVEYLRKNDWTDEQIILFYTLRQVSQSHQQQVDIDIDTLLPQYLASLKQRFGLNGPETIEKYAQVVDKLLPYVDNWKEIEQQYFYPGPQEPERFTNRISTDSNQYRDQYHASLIVDAVKDSKKVFAIAGSAHAVMQEPALRALLSENSKN